MHGQQNVKFWNRSCIKIKQIISAVIHSKFKANDVFLQSISHLRVYIYFVGQKEKRRNGKVNKNLFSLNKIF